MTNKWLLNMSPMQSTPVIDQTKTVLSVSEQAIDLLEKKIDEDRSNKPYSERVKKNNGEK